MRCHLESVGIRQEFGAQAAPDFRHVAWYKFSNLRALIHLLYQAIVESTFENAVPIFSLFEVPELGGKM
jgi:hypothetical protein